jgi:hypothetical protein
VQVLRSVPSCPPVPPLTHTACGLIRKYAPWLANSGVEQPELLQLVPPLFRQSIAALDTNLSAGGGSLAFAELCRLCAPSVAEHCRNDMMATFQKATASETWQGRDAKGQGDVDGRSAPASTSGHGHGPLEEEDVSSIIEGTAVVLAYEASLGNAEVCCNTMLPQCERICSHLHHESAAFRCIAIDCT